MQDSCIQDCIQTGFYHPECLQTRHLLAEGEGFEPTVRLPVHRKLEIQLVRQRGQKKRMRRRSTTLPVG